MTDARCYKILKPSTQLNEVDIDTSYINRCRVQWLGKYAEVVMRSWAEIAQ